MKCMERNKSDFYYALFLRKEPIVDDNGHKTGESEVFYGNPVALSGNVSSGKGETVSRQFGEDVSYDKVIVLDDPDTPIDEFSILWIDTLPVIVDGETTTPHDYIVKKVAKSINSVSIAVNGVNVR